MSTISKKSSVYLASSVFVLMPFVAFAQPKTLETIINIIIGYLNQILFLLIGVAIVFFVWYVIKYFIRPNEERKDAGEYVMYSLIGFFVILSLWGMVNVLQNTFGLENNQPTWSSFKGLFPGGGGTYNNINGSGGTYNRIGGSGGTQSTIGGSGPGGATDENSSYDPYSGTNSSDSTYDPFSGTRQ